MASIKIPFNLASLPGARGLKTLPLSYRLIELSSKTLGVIYKRSLVSNPYLGFENE